MAEQRREPPMGTDTTVAEKPRSSGATATLTDAPRAQLDVGSATRRAAGELASIDPARYELGDELARGGMGRIRAALDVRLGREVAIKELLAPSGGLAARFEREALVTARLQHPSIVAVYEAGRWPSGAPFYAMKLVQGRSLKEVLAAAPDLDARLALLPHVSAVADATAYAHEHRIIHRDLKPANVLVGRFGETVVIDWGLAKDLAADEADTAGESDRDSDPVLTRVGSVLGTPSYMAPEQARGEPADERADVYAIGAMLYHLLAGEAPFTGADSDRVIASVATEAPPPLRERVRGLAPDLLAIVERAMARARRDRYPSAGELAEDLRRFLTGRLVSSHRYTRGELVRRFVRRHRLPLAIAGAAFAIIAASSAYSVRRVIAERDQARTERERADDKQREAEQQRAQALHNFDYVWLKQARDAVVDDPVSALGNLKTLSHGTDLTKEARLIASAARDEGLPKISQSHTQDIRDIAASRDGKQVATASADATVRIWDVSKFESRVLGRLDGVECVAFSPDGKSVASGALDGTLRVWDVATGSSFTLAHPDRVLKVAFSPDGSALATWASDSRLRVWDVAHHTLTRTLPLAFPEQLVFASGSAVVSACVSPPDPQFRIVGCGSVHRVDLATGVDTILVANATGFAATPDGSHFATVSGNRGLEIWSSSTWQARPIAYHRALAAIAIAADGTAVAGYSREDATRLHVWSGPQLAPRELASAADGEKLTLLFSPDGDKLAVLSKVGVITDVATGEMATLPARFASQLQHTVYVGNELIGSHQWFLYAVSPPVAPRIVAADVHARQIAYTRDGRLLVIGADRIVFEGEARSIALPSPLVGRAAISADVARAAALGEDGVLRVIELSTGAMRELAGKVTVTPRRFPRDPKLMRTHANGSFDIEVRREARALLENAGERELAVFSPDGSALACSDTQGGRVHVWELATGAERVLELGDTDVEAIAFTRDSQTVIAGDSHGKLHLIARATGADRIIEAHTAPIERIAVSPNGDRVASVGADAGFHIWDLATGKPSPGFSRGNPITALAISPDGKTYIDGEATGGVIAWNDPPDGFRGAGGMDAPVLALAFSPDGSTDAVATTAGAELAMIDGWHRTLVEGHAIFDIAFAPDGNHVAGVGDDGLVRVWRDDLPRDEAGLRAFIEDAYRKI